MGWGGGGDKESLNLEFYVLCALSTPNSRTSEDPTVTDCSVNRKLKLNKCMVSSIKIK